MFRIVDSEQTRFIDNARAKRCDAWSKQVLIRKVWFDRN